eukprot:jgi/Tetstr1/424121/TSEL_014730.t1
MLSADEWEVAAEQLCGADGGCWRGLLRGVCLAACDGVDRAALALRGAGPGLRVGSHRRVSGTATVGQGAGLTLGLPDVLVCS